MSKQQRSPTRTGSARILHYTSCIFESNSNFRNMRIVIVRVGLRKNRLPRDAHSFFKKRVDGLRNLSKRDRLV